MWNIFERRVRPPSPSPVGAVAPREATGPGAKRNNKLRRVGYGINDSPDDFEDRPIDLDRIQNAYNTESYVRRAVDKYAELMFKEGWDITGANDDATEYLWTRIKLMEEATGRSIGDTLMDAAMDLVKFGNAYLIKARQSGGYKLPVNAQGYSGNQPVVGYFVLPANTMRVSRDVNGKILKYEQDASGETKEFNPTEIIHMTHKKPTGRAYGVPFVQPVLNDILILRQIEENVARLIHRNLFPMYKYKVGTDTPGYEATDEEIEAAEEDIQTMTMDGIWVMSERHDMQVVGGDTNGMDASEYLKIFRQRVFSGLGVSGISMGISEGASRATASSLSAEMIDGVKEFQRILSSTITHQIVHELLFEGGYDPTLNPEDQVDFRFFEIDLDSKVKKENHAIQMFNNNATHHNELREDINRDAMTEEELGMTAFYMFQQAPADSEESVDNDDQPENQEGQKSSPGGSDSGRSTDENLDNPEKIQEKSAKVLTDPREVVSLHSKLPLSGPLHTLTSAWKRHESIGGSSSTALPRWTTDVPRKIADDMTASIRQAVADTLPSDDARYVDYTPVIETATDAWLRQADQMRANLSQRLVARTDTPPTSFWYAEQLKWKQAVTAHVARACHLASYWAIEHTDHTPMLVDDQGNTHPLDPIPTDASLPDILTTFSLYDSPHMSVGMDPTTKEV